jgi:hypothetical protein
VDHLIDEALAFPHQQSLESMHQQLDAWANHTTLDRLGQVKAPTLVIAGARTSSARPTSAEPSLTPSPAPCSRYGPKQPTSRSKKTPTNSTPGSRPSGRPSSADLLVTTAEQRHPRPSLTRPLRTAYLSVDFSSAAPSGFVDPAERCQCQEASVQIDHVRQLGWPTRRASTSRA